MAKRRIKQRRRMGHNDRIQHMALEMTRAMFQVLERDHGFKPDMLGEFHLAWLAQMKRNRVHGLPVSEAVIRAMGEVQE